MCILYKHTVVYYTTALVQEQQKKHTGLQTLPAHTSTNNEPN